MSKLTSYALNSLLLANIVRIFKTCLLERGFYTLIKNVLFSSPTDVGSHNPPSSRVQRLRWHSFPSTFYVRSLNLPSFGVQHLCWHTILCPPPSGSASLLTHRLMSSSDTICNSSSSLLANIVLFEHSLLGFLPRFLNCVC